MLFSIQILSLFFIFLSHAATAVKKKRVLRQKPNKKPNKQQQQQQQQPEWYNQLLSIQRWAFDIL